MEVIKGERQKANLKLLALMRERVVGSGNRLPEITGKVKAKTYKDDGVRFLRRKADSFGLFSCGRFVLMNILNSNQKTS